MKWLFFVLLVIAYVVFVVPNKEEKSGNRTNETTKSPKTERAFMVAEFNSMQGCLASIPVSANSSIGKIYTDKPEKASGLLSNGEQFSCTRKSTGTKGIYYEGWYTQKE